MICKIENVKIESVSSFLPKDKIDFAHFFPKFFGEKRVAETIRATGIAGSRIAGANETSSDLCLNAAISLIEKEGIDKLTIDGLVFVSQTADYILPSTSIILQNKLGLSKNIVCLDIHYGCSGYIYGLLQAAMWVNSGMCKRVLLLSGETNSKMVNSKDCALKMVFGDAGTATIVSVGKSEMCFAIHSDGSGYDKLIIPAGGFRKPTSTETRIPIEDQDGNIRTQEDMYMNGMGIFSFAISNVPKNIKEVLSYQGWEKDNVSLYILHQANRFIIDCIRKQLGLQWDVVPLNLQHVGNTGPASIPLLLSEMGNLFSQDARKNVVFSGFGVGLSWGAVTCDLSGTHFYEPINK